MKMPFGKHKDIEIEKIPISYITWLLNNSKNLDYYLKKYIENYLYKIEHSFENVTEQKIKKIYYELCKKYHPDISGGNNEGMKAINDFYNLLKDK